MDLENGIRHWGRRWGAVLTWQDMVQFVYLVSVNPACCFHAWLHFKLSLSASASTWAWLSHLLTEWCWNLPEHRTSQLQEMEGLPVQNNKGLECLLPACRHCECWRREWMLEGERAVPHTFHQTAVTRLLELSHLGKVEEWANYGMLLAAWKYCRRSDKL